MSTEDRDASPSSRARNRRRRRDAYATQACERCRSRKQRCRWDENGSSEAGAVCFNCRDSRKECILAARDESARRQRTTLRQDTATPSSYYARTSASPKGRTAEESSEPIQDWSGDAWGTDADVSASVAAPIAGPSQTVEVVPISNRGAGPGSDWSSWHVPQTGDLDYNSLLSLSGQIRAQDTSAQHVLLGVRPTITSQTVPTISVQSFGDQTRETGPPSPSSRTRQEAAKGLAMITLEAAAEPHYVGESSGSFWSSVVGQGMYEPSSSNGAGKHTQRNFRNRSPSPTDHHILRASLQRQLSDEVARHILLTVYRHLHSRYPFLDWVAFDRHWQAREGLLLAIAIDRKLNEEASIAAFFVLMVLAIGAHLCKSDHLAGILRPEEYFALAQPFLPVIVQLHNLVNVQGLLLVAMYSLRDSRGPSVWFLSGVTMRLCVSLGLHREVTTSRGRGVDSYQAELRKRNFWSCYVLDRMMSMTLGRPPGISDDDIDVSFPNAQTESINLPVPEMCAQSMISAIHYFKLKRIESQIQRVYYTVAGRDRSQARGSSWPLLQMLDQWEADIPVEARSRNAGNLPCCSKDWFQLRGIEARLHLLRPMCPDTGQTSDEFLTLLAQNAAKGCELQKKTHQFGQPTSNTSVHSTFICGLALLYALFRDPKILPLREVFSAIKAASATLFAYSQSDTSSAALHDVFEELSGACMDKIGAYASEAVSQVPVAPNDWQTASAQATSSLNPETADDYSEFLQNLGIGGQEGLTVPTNPFAESLWDLAVFSPGIVGSDMT